MESVLAPALAPFLERYPDIRIEISVDAARRDIVAERFDAGIRFGQRVERDMVALRISDDVRQSVVASPAYLQRRAAPERPQDLRAHNCIRLRMPDGGTWPWEFRQKGKRVEIAPFGKFGTAEMISVNQFLYKCEAAFGNYEEALAVAAALPARVDITILQQVDCLVALGRRAEAIALLERNLDLDGWRGKLRRRIVDLGGRRLRALN